MLSDEYGQPQAARSPWLAATSTLSASVVCGLVPLLPFLIGMRNAIVASTFLTGAVFFLIGSMKSRWSTASWWRSGFSTFLVGGVAASLSYLVGVVLKNFLQ